MADTTKRVYRPDELVILFRVSRSTIYRRLSTGEIPCIRIGPTLRIPAEWVHSQLSLVNQERQKASQVSRAGLTR